TRTHLLRIWRSDQPAADKLPTMAPSILFRQALRMGAALVSAALIFALPACSQQAPSERPGAPAVERRRVGGACDGCELMYEGLPERLNHVDTSEAWHQPGQKLVVKGTVHGADGKSRAPGV